MKVKCQRCGTEYEMPDIPNVNPIMEDCPICKDLEKTMREMGLK